MLGFKFQILLKTDGFLIYSKLECIHICTVHRGPQWRANIRQVIASNVKEVDCSTAGHAEHIHSSSAAWSLNCTQYCLRIKFVPHREHVTSAAATGRVTLFKETTAAVFQTHTNDINTRCGQDEALLKLSSIWYMQWHLYLEVLNYTDGFPTHLTWFFYVMPNSLNRGSPVFIASHGQNSWRLNCLPLSWLRH
jgi:hypothetical protein